MTLGEKKEKTCNDIAELDLQIETYQKIGEFQLLEEAKNQRKKLVKRLSEIDKRIVM